MIPVTVFRIVDGDTVVGTIHLPYEVDIRNQEIRALGYDAWESRKVSRSGSVGISQEEMDKGKVAKAYLDSLMSEAKEVYIVPGLKPWDSFGRALGHLHIERTKGSVESVAQLMSQGGHCRPCPLEESPNDDTWWDLDKEEDLTNRDD